MPKTDKGVRPATTEYPRVFSPEQLRWAEAWECVAPGWIGWSVFLTVTDEGDECLLVAPPGTDNYAFMLEPTADCQSVVVYWRADTVREICRGNSLRDALLFLCPLSEQQMTELQRIVASLPAWPYPGETIAE